MLSLIALAAVGLVVILAVAFLFRWRQGQVVDRIWENDGAVLVAVGNRADALTPPADIRIVSLDLEKNSFDDFALITTYSAVDNLSLQNGRLTRDHWNRITAIPGLQRLRLTDVEVDDSFSQIIQCVSLTSLLLEGSAFNDMQLLALSSLRRLETLYLLNTKVTSDGLAGVANLSSLHTLVVRGTPGITDAGLVHLRDLQEIRTLELSETGIDGSGLKHLSKLQALESVSLSNTRCTSESVAALIEGQRIRGLYLNDTNVDDSIMDVVSQCAHLQYLHIESTQITDAGLLKLRESPDLERVTCGPPVTRQGAAKFQKRFPDAIIVWEGPEGPLALDELFEHADESGQRSP